MILIALFCRACNFPQQSRIVQEVNVETAVASTLTAQSFSQDPPVPTTTPLPEALLPTTVPAVITEIGTLTPSLTMTYTLTLTLTPTPENPRQSLGEPAWKNNLDTGKAFGLTANYGDDAGNSITIANGMMTMTNPNTNGYLMWRLTVATPNDVYFEAEFKNQNCSGNDQFGITFRSPDYSNGFGYYFGITCNGSYNLYRRDAETGKTSLIPLTPSTNILSGPGQINILGVLTKANNIKLYANGKLLQEINDSKFPQGGNFGPFIMGFSGNNSIALDNIAYWLIQ
jgi:hypothetical protein